MIPKPWRWESLRMLSALILWAWDICMLCGPNDGKGHAVASLIVILAPRLPRTVFVFHVSLPLVSYLLFSAASHCSHPLLEDVVKSRISPGCEVRWRTCIGRLIFIHLQRWEVLPFCRFQRQRCIKILCPKDPDFYTPLALKTAKGKHLPALEVYKIQSPMYVCMYVCNAM